MEYTLLRAFLRFYYNSNYQPIYEIGSVENDFWYQSLLRNRINTLKLATDSIIFFDE